MFVVNFNEIVTLGLPDALPFTNSPDALESAIFKARTEGMTALYDAVIEAQERLRAGRHDKKVLIVISDGGDNASVHSLAEALKLDMAAWFTPTAANFFGRISRPVILEMLAEAQGKPPGRSVSQLKKPALAAHAERAIVGTGWLPRPMLPIAGTAELDDAESDALIDEAA